MSHPPLPHRRNEMPAGEINLLTIPGKELGKVCIVVRLLKPADHFLVGKQERILDPTCHNEPAPKIPYSLKENS